MRLSATAITWPHRSRRRQSCSAPAFASHAGEGWAGELNDKVITFFSLGVLLFFVLVVVVFSWIQGRLEKRKDEQKAAKALARTGW